jgi:hypothetical protein
VAKVLVTLTPFDRGRLDDIIDAAQWRARYEHCTVEVRNSKGELVYTVTVDGDGGPLADEHISGRALIEWVRETERADRNSAAAIARGFDPALKVLASTCLVAVLL